MWMSRMLPWRHGSSTRWTRSLPNIGAASSPSRRFLPVSAATARVGEQIHVGTRFADRARGRRRRGHERASNENLHRSRRDGRSGRSHRRSAGGSWTGGRNASTHCPPLDRGPGTPAPSRRDGLGLRPAGRRQRPPRQRLTRALGPGVRRAVCDTLPRVSCTSGRSIGVGQNQDLDGQHRVEDCPQSDEELPTSLPLVLRNP